MLLGKYSKRTLTAGLCISLVLANIGGWPGSARHSWHVSAAGEASQAVGVNVQYHTQDEIREYVQANGLTFEDALTFAEDPVTEAPYGLGRLSDETLQSSLAMLNQIRYIAGLDDDVQLSVDYTELAQAASLANYVNGKLSHTPAQPEGMSDEMYALAEKGAGSTNIAWASYSEASMNTTLALGWMDDGDNNNIDCVGHRRWILNPTMKKTGFGAVSGSKGTYSAVYAFDRTGGNTDVHGVMWPAQNMPLEYFEDKFPWSVSTGEQLDASKIQVKLTRESDGKEWNFSQSSSDGDFYVDNGNYGQKGCIIFRPDVSAFEGYQPGDVFEVEITGLSTDISYTVNFFTLTKSTDAEPTPTANASAEPGATPTAGASMNPGTTPTASAKPTPTPGTSTNPGTTPTASAKPTPTAIAGTVPTPAPGDSTAPGTTEGPDASTDPGTTAKPDASTEPGAAPTSAADNAAAAVAPADPAAASQSQPVDLSQSAKMTLQKTSYTYDGKEKKPAVTVTAGAKTLAEGTDYTVQYQNNSKVGTASVTVYGQGSYTGQITGTFVILPKGIGMLGKIKAKTKGFTVTWKKQGKSITGYQIQYSTNKNFTGKSTASKVLGRPSATNLTVRKLKAGKKYYVRIRTYQTAGGKKYYSAWSKSKQIKTKK